MRSILALPNDYVVIDLETTGQFPRHDDIIEISAVRYRNGIETDCFDHLVSIDRPIPAFVSRLTGITDDMLAGKPHIRQLLPALVDFLGDDILIGHNIACFDSLFLAKVYEDHLGKELENPCVDTLRIAKRLIPNFPRHSLQFLANHFGIEQTNTHRGKADCNTTHALYQAMRNEIISTCGEEAFINFSARKPKTKVSEIVPESAITNTEHPFYQKVLVFTGALSLTREEAMQLAVNVGAIVKTSVTKKTNYLVVGGQNLTRVGEDGMSSKEEKAYQLNAEEKATIQIISESDFLKLIETPYSCCENEQLSLDEVLPEPSIESSCSDERKAFELLYPEIKSVIFNAPIDSGILRFHELGNCSSVYFGESNEVFIRIRIRKKSRYILMPQEHADLLPAGTETILKSADNGMLRIPIQSYEEIIKYGAAFKGALERLCRKHRDFGCCGRYEACSDAGTCVHPDPKFAIRCWYHQNLLEGKIFYGKNKNI